MKLPSEILSRPIYLLLVFSFIFFGGYFLYLTINSQKYEAADQREIENEFNHIKPPDGSAQVTVIRRSSRLTEISISADFLSKLNDEELNSYYKKELIANGWRCLTCTIKSSIKYPMHQSMEFCKSYMNAVVEIIERNNDGVRYYFGINKRGNAKACYEEANGTT